MKSIIISELELDEIKIQLNEISKKLENSSPRNSLSEKWLDNQDVCLILKVSTRTLQNYRDRGVLAFSQNGNKIYYKAEDIDKYLESNYKPHF